MNNMNMNDEQLGQIKQAYAPVVRECVSMSDSGSKTVTLHGVAPAKTGASWTHMVASIGTNESSITSVCKALRTWVGQTDTPTNGFNAEKVSSTFRSCEFWGDLFADVIPTPATPAPVAAPATPAPVAAPAPATPATNNLTPAEISEIENHTGEWFARMKNGVKSYKTWESAFNGATNSLLGILSLPRRTDEDKALRATVKEQLSAFTAENLVFVNMVHRNLVSSSGNTVGAVTETIRNHVIAVGAAHGVSVYTGTTKTVNASIFTALNRN